MSVSHIQCHYPLVNFHITMENHHFYGKIHYKWPFSIATLNYQRVQVIGGIYHTSRPDGISSETAEMATDPRSIPHATGKWGMFLSSNHLMFVGYLKGSKITEGVSWLLAIHPTYLPILRDFTVEFP